MMIQLKRNLISFVTFLTRVVYSEENEAMRDLTWGWGGGVTCIARLVT